MLRSEWWFSLGEAGGSESRVRVEAAVSEVGVHGGWGLPVPDEVSVSWHTSARGCGFTWFLHITKIRWLHVTKADPPNQSWVNNCGTEFVQLGFEGGLSDCAEQSSQMEVMYICDKKKSLSGWEVPEELHHLLQMFSHLSAPKNRYKLNQQMNQQAKRILPV